MKLAIALLLTLLALPAHAGLTVRIRLYDPNTNISAAPVTTQHTPNRLPLLGMFGAEYEGKGRVRPVASFETNACKPWEPRGNDFISLAGVFYHIGLRADLTPRLMLEAKHGSWHNLDIIGDIEHYNYVGLEYRPN